MKKVLGSCNSCGQCCRLIGLPDTGEYKVDTQGGTVSVPMPDNPSEAWLKFLEARGAQIEDGWVTLPTRPGAREPVVRIRYGPRRFPVLLVKHTCPQLDDDNNCKLHGTPDFPDVCAGYPKVDDDLTIVPDCGYRVANVPSDR